MYNGIAMRLSDTLAHTYQTSKWQLNQLQGAMVMGEGRKPKGKLMSSMSPK
eukprot:CAMPEP_0184683580 /NCGR_PEP_ID=MMETSP0312-20130426/11894_1 /TAXON_ID=31354 /ORGANISM="Compsopogon coeruleus, Strain SAG 36.94" /LENGTH=50 /DNA_ID=CAMNT_0027136035 /DNA_START=9 /DNA_END=158 /DNA_ORIENTATION=+